MSVKPEMELIFTIAPMENTLNVKYLERYARVAVINKHFASMAWFQGSTNPKWFGLIHCQRLLEVTGHSYRLRFERGICQLSF